LLGGGFVPIKVAAIMMPGHQLRRAEQNLMIRVMHQVLCLCLICCEDGIKLSLKKHLLLAKLRELAFSQLGFSMSILSD
jgi:hypothetical protein